MGKNNDTNNAPKKKNLVWTQQMDDWFIDVMLHEARQGNRVDEIFTTTAYVNMVNELRDKFQMPDLKKEHLKNRMKTLKSWFAECYDIFRGGLRGFNWSYETKLWSAEPEVWNALIESKPAAAKWRTKPIHNYDGLEKLFAKDRATGDHTETAKEKLKKWKSSSENPIAIDDIDFGISENEFSLENTNELFEVEENIPQKTKNKVQKGIDKQSDNGATSKTKKRKVSTSSSTEQTNFGEVIGRVIESMSVDNERLIEAIATGNREFVQAIATGIKEFAQAIKDSKEKEPSADKIYHALVDLNLEEVFREDAYDYLSDNVVKAKSFFGLPMEARKDALERWMRRT